MKAIFVAVFVVAVSTAPLPENASGSDAVEMIVNGVPHGAALEVGDLVDITLKKHADGAVVATDLLHPYSAAGMAEAAAAAASIVPNVASIGDDDMKQFARHLQIKPILLPSSVVEPEHPIPVIPEPIVMPPPAVPEVAGQPEQLPVAAPQMNGQMYSDPSGHVQVQYNGPEEPGMLATLQDWFQVVVNYFSPPSNAPPSAFPDPRHHIH